MEREELYIEFVDGTLDTDSELEFAQKFTTDESFRSGFRAYLKLINTINKNTRSYGPTLEETNQLFTKLGYTTPILLAPAHTNTKKKGKFLLFSKYFTTVILSSIITILLLGIYKDDNYVKFGSKQLNKSENGLAEKNNPAISTIQREGELSKFKSNNLKSNENDEESSNSTDIHHNIKLFENNNLNTDTSNFSNKNIDRLEYLDIALTNNQIPITNLFNQTNRDYYQNTPINELFNISSEPQNIKIENNFIIEFKNSPTLFFNPPKVNPNNLNEFNNIDLSILYQLSRNISMGLNLKQETFYLDYDGIDNTGKEYQTYQHPNLTSIGLISRYKPFKIAQNFEPIIQICLSINNNGLITRELIGLEYYPVDNFYFIIGTEINQFFFQHQKKLFNANKISLNYGIGVKL